MIGELSFLKVLLAVVFLLLFMVPGFILQKTKLFPDGADKTFSNAVLYVCQPALVFMSFQTNYSSEIVVNMLITFGLAVFVHAFMIALMFVAFRNKNNEAKINCMRFASVFSNAGFMGLPFLEIILPQAQNVIIYAGVVLAVFNMFTWSLGVFMISGDKKQISLKKAVLNPTIIGLLLGILFFVIVKKPMTELCVAGSFGDDLLSGLSNNLTFLKNMVTPVSMFVLGIKLAKASLGEIFLNKTAYLGSFNKLVIMGLVSLFSVVFFPIATEIKLAIFFLLAMPSAASTVLFSVTFGGDTETATSTVLLSTILSVITIPLFFLLFKALLGA